MGSLKGNIIMKFNYPEIKNWGIVNSSGIDEMYRAPECRSSYLYGEVYGHPKFEDGMKIATSAIKRFIHEQDVIIVETKNSKYIIEEKNIDKNYEKAFGNVWKKLIESIEV